MATMTHKHSNPLIYAVVLIALAVAAMASLAPSQHAVMSHYEAVDVIRCINNNGPHLKLAYLSKDNKFYLPCQMPDGQIGLGIFTKEGDNISAYIPKDGTWQSVRNYIEQRATRIGLDRWPAWLR